MVSKPVICVFCGSSPGVNPVHLEAARALAKVFHKHGISLVYGGGTTGLMGEVARTLVSLSGPESVHGVIPAALLPLEAQRQEDSVVHNGDAQTSLSPTATKVKDITQPDEQMFGKTTVVPDMHTRKRMMADLVGRGGKGSGFIALSGGYGTIEELMEITTWNQLGIHALGVCVFNVDGYWDGIMQWVRKAVDAGFVQKGNASILVEATTAEECVKLLDEYEVAEGRFKLSWNDESHKEPK